MLTELPSGETSHSRTKKSVWSRLELTQSSASTLPIRTRGSISRSEVYTRTSGRASSARLSTGPPVSMPMPPMDGVGSAGS